MLSVVVPQSNTRVKNPMSHHAAPCAWTTCSGCLLARGQPGGEGGTSYPAPCRWVLQDGAAGNPSRLCRQGFSAWHNFFCQSSLPPNVLGWSCPSKTVPISHPCLGRRDGVSPRFPAPSSCPKCQAQPAAPSCASDLSFTAAPVLVTVANWIIGENSSVEGTSGVRLIPPLSQIRQIFQLLLILPPSVRQHRCLHSVKEPPWSVIQCCSGGGRKLASSPWSIFMFFFPLQIQ